MSLQLKLESYSKSFDRYIHTHFFGIPYYFHFGVRVLLSESTSKGRDTITQLFLKFFHLFRFGVTVIRYE